MSGMGMPTYTPPVSFIENTLIDPETLQPFALTGAERIFLEHAFKQTADGRLEFPELVFSGPKKSGKNGGLNGAAAALGFSSLSALQDAILAYCG